MIATTAVVEEDGSGLKFTFYSARGVPTEVRLPRRRLAVEFETACSDIMTWTAVTRRVIGRRVS